MLKWQTPLMASACSCHRVEAGRFGGAERLRWFWPGKSCDRGMKRITCINYRRKRPSDRMRSVQNRILITHQQAERKTCTSGLKVRQTRTRPAARPAPPPSSGCRNQYLRRSDTEEAKGGPTPVCNRHQRSSKDGDKAPHNIEKNAQARRNFQRGRETAPLPPKQDFPSSKNICAGPG